jgi:hypothetical protein
MFITREQFKVTLHVNQRFLDFARNDNSTNKIFFADRDHTSIFGAYRIRSVRDFVARPEAGFLSPGVTTFGGALLLGIGKCPRLIN